MFDWVLVRVLAGSLGGFSQESPLLFNFVFRMMLEGAPSTQFEAQIILEPSIIIPSPQNLVWLASD